MDSEFLSSVVHSSVTFTLRGEIEPLSSEFRREHNPFF